MLTKYKDDVDVMLCFVGRALMIKVAELIPRHPSRSGDKASSSGQTSGKQQIEPASGGVGALPARSKKGGSKGKKHKVCDFLSCDR